MGTHYWEYILQCMNISSGDTLLGIHTTVHGPNLGHLALGTRTAGNGDTTGNIYYSAWAQSRPPGTGYQDQMVYVPQGVQNMSVIYHDRQLSHPISQQSNPQAIRFPVLSASSSQVYSDFNVVGQPGAAGVNRD